MNKVKLVKMCRFQFLRYVNRVTIRTFDKKVYILKTNLMVKNMETDNILRLEDIYYDIRTVRHIFGNQIARRKNKNSDLFLEPTREKANVKAKAM